jgi:hypothetical protein
MLVPACIFGLLGLSMLALPKPWMRLAALYRSGSVLSLGADIRRPLNASAWLLGIRLTGLALLLLAVVFLFTLL